MYKKQSSKIRLQFQKRLDIFRNDPFDTILNNHSLSGKIKDYRSIDVTGDIRAWYKVEENVVVFAKIGTHSELYN